MDFNFLGIPNFQMSKLQISKFSRNLAWALLGPTLGPLSMGLAQLGPSLGLQPWALLGPAWNHLKKFWASLVPVWTQLGPS